MRSGQRFISLIIALLATCIIMLVATFLAQASPFSASPAWMAPQEVSQSDDDRSIGPDIAVDSDNNLHLIWMEGPPVGNLDLHYVKSTDRGNSWSSPDPIIRAKESFHGYLALAADDSVHVCWWEKPGPLNYELLYASRTGDAWGLAETVVMTTSDIKDPCVGLTNGDIHVLWSNKPAEYGHDLYYTRKASGGEWFTATIAADTGPSSFHARMAIDNAGDLHVTWQDEDGTGDDVVYYMSGTVGAASTTWSLPITVSNNITEATAPDIAVVDDTVHIVLGSKITYDEQYVLYVNFPIHSPPDPISPTLIPGSRVDVFQIVPYYPNPAIGLIGTDEVHVVWNGAMSEDMSDRVYYAMSVDQGASWSTPGAISANDAWPDGFTTIAADGTFVHVAWQQKSGADKDIYYAHNLPLATYQSLALKNY